MVDEARGAGAGPGRVLRLAAAPLPARGEDLEVEVRWLADAALRGGVVRASIPARGADPRAAPDRFQVVRSPGLLGPSVAGRGADRIPVVLDPWVPAEIQARAPTAAGPKGSGAAFPCGPADQRCARLRLAAGPEPGRDAREIAILVDASPSTVGPPRGRAAPALSGLLAAAPEGSRAVVYAFAARADPVVPSPLEATEVPLRPLADAAFAELGSATRFEVGFRAVARALALRARQGRRAPLIVLVGDGGLTPGPAAEAAFEEARRQGIEVAAVDLGDDPTHPALIAGVTHTGGAVVAAGALARQVLREGPSEALVAQLAAVFAPKVARRLRVRGDGGQVLAELGPLAAGEERRCEGVLPPGVRRVWLAAGAAGRVPARWGSEEPAVAAAMAARVLDRRPLFLGVAEGDTAQAPPSAPPEARACPLVGPPRTPSGVSTDRAPVALAEDCEAPPEDEDEDAARASTRDPTLGRGVPSATVLSLLRQRVVPVARRCFRRDRAGRADYAVRAVFEFRLEDREVLDARVEGEMTEALRSCLRAAVEELLVPALDGVVVVRYPVHTQREPPPRAIELTPEVADALDRAIP